MGITVRLSHRRCVSCNSMTPLDPIPCVWCGKGAPVREATPEELDQVRHNLVPRHYQGPNGKRTPW